MGYTCLTGKLVNTSIIKHYIYNTYNNVTLEIQCVKDKSTAAHRKIKILSSFAHLHVIPNPSEEHKRMCRMTASVTIHLFPCMGGEEMQMKVNGD